MPGASRTGSSPSRESVRGGLTANNERTAMKKTPRKKAAKKAKAEHATLRDVLDAMFSMDRVLTKHSLGLASHDARLSSLESRVPASQSIDSLTPKSDAAKPGDKVGHCCGLTGFDVWRGDTCPACDQQNERSKLPPPDAAKGLRDDLEFVMNCCHSGEGLCPFCKDKLKKAIADIDAAAGEAG